MSIILEKSLTDNKYSAFIHPSYDLERKLLLSIEEGNLTNGIKILQEINTFERARLSNIPIQSLRYSLVATCTLFTRACIRAKVDPETAFTLSDYYINLIDRNSNKHNIQAIEYKMLEDFVELIISKKTYIYSPPINNTIKYIKHNIESQLTLQELAENINVHPNYLSNFFKKEVGKTVLEYIHEEKISSIKNYLIYTTAPISEISTIFDFNSTSYFSKYFKNHTNMTPLEFRTKHGIY